MKRLDTTPITTSVAMPLKSGILDFMQDAHKETTQALISTIIDNPTTGTIYVLSGCVNTGSGANYIISAGQVFYNGEIFQVDATSFTIAGSQYAFANLLTTQYTTNADPVTFTDATPRNVCNIRKIEILSSAGSGYPLYSDFVFLDNIQAELTSLKSLVAGIVPYIPKNRGFFSGLNINQTSGSLTVGGNVSSAVCGAVGDTYGVLVTMANAMPNTNYKIRAEVESQGTSVIADVNAGVSEFKVISTTQFYFIIGEFSPSSQNLKVHIETYAL